MRIPKKKGQLYNYGSGQTWIGQCPGVSVFKKDKETGAIYHTYSTFAAGLQELNVCLSLLDLIPEGRQDRKSDKNEKENMYWVKHKEDY